MLIEQTNEFESRVPRPLAVHIFLKLLILMTKNKNLQDKSSSEL